MRILSVLLLVVVVASCSEDESQVKDMRDPDAIVEDIYIPDESPAEDQAETDPADPIESTKPNTDSEWSYEVTFISEDNWGYKILQKGKPFINQTSIPSVPGINGFDTEEKAERTAKFILDKVENGIIPPTVDKEDLEKLGVLRD